MQAVAVEKPVRDFGGQPIARVPKPARKQAAAGQGDADTGAGKPAAQGGDGEAVAFPESGQGAAGLVEASPGSAGIDAPGVAGKGVALGFVDGKPVNDLAVGGVGEPGGEVREPVRRLGFSQPPAAVAQRGRAWWKRTSQGSMPKPRNSASISM